MIGEVGLNVNNVPISEALKCNIQSKHEIVYGSYLQQRSVIFHSSIKLRDVKRGLATQITKISGILLLLPVPNNRL